MMSDSTEAWFTFKIDDADEAGIETTKLARLLNELSAALYAIARVQLDELPNRPGRRTYRESLLAGARVRSIHPGSTTIELTPPAGAEAQARLMEDEPDPDTVVEMFAAEIVSIERKDPVSPKHGEIRAHVRRVLESAGDMGSRGTLVHRPLRSHAGGPLPRQVTTFQIRELPDEETTGKPWTVRRTLSGRAFMADVESGREKMRLKLPGGRDLTLDAGPQAVRDIGGNLERLVEVDIVESMQGEASASRMVESVRILPAADIPSDVPPKTLDEIEAELDLPPKPNYLALATAVWRNAEEVDDFLVHVRQIRRPASAASRADD